jgi:hypothetical protein
MRKAGVLLGVVVPHNWHWYIVMEGVLAGDADETRGCEEKPQPMIGGGGARA